MKRLSILLLVLTLVVSLAALLPAGAQDDMAPHVCDSTLIALLYIAEHDYGFHSMMDVSTFDKGQYAPLFDAMMAEMGDDMMEATEEPMMDEEMASGEMMEGMTMLTPGHIEGEDEACTALRDELDAFLYAKLSESMMMGEG